MAAASSLLISNKSLAAEIIQDIDFCMDLLKQQLNKNPKSRFDRDHPQQPKGPKRRRYNAEEEKIDISHSSSHHNKQQQPHQQQARKKKSKKPRNLDVFMSKRLSFYLRHGAEKAGLRIRNDGYVRLADILKLNEFKQHHATFEKIKQIVDENDKQRFSMMQENEIWYIRANQGHSIKSIESEQLLQEITLSEVKNYPIVCHGTYLKVWDAVKQEGLKTMSRNHIHFVPSDTVKGKGVISGMRYNCQILIYIDLYSAIKDGIKFFLSANNVILSSGLNGQLSPKYFLKVVRFEKGQPGKVIWSKEQKETRKVRQNQHENDVD